MTEAHPDGQPSGPTVSRRRLLSAAGGLAGVTLLTGCSGGLPIPGRVQSTCVPRGQLDRRIRLGGLPLVYEVSGRRSAFWFDRGFAGQLDSWLTELGQLGPRSIEVSTYGAWTDGGRDCRSWHDSGRAFDVARLRRQGGVISCRYDQWRTATGATLSRALRDYWALAASLHRHFAYVVTYLYNTEHHNHIHVDNGRSGTGRSVFDPGSITQVQAVQAIATHVWNRPLEITGRFDAATRRTTEGVLGAIGAETALTASAGWDRYLSASAARITR